MPRATVTEETYDAAGQAPVDSTDEPFAADVRHVRRATGDRWLNVGVRPEEQTP